MTDRATIPTQPSIAEILNGPHARHLIDRDRLGPVVQIEPLQVIAYTKMVAGYPHLMRKACP